MTGPAIVTESSSVPRFFEYMEFAHESLKKGVQSPFDRLFGGIIFEDDQFLDKIEETAKDREAGEELSGLRKSITVPEVMEKTIAFYKREPCDITKRNRNNYERKTAIYLSKKLTIATNNEIGSHSDNKGSGISHQVK